MLAVSYIFAVGPSFTIGCIACTCLTPYAGNGAIADDAMASGVAKGAVPRAQALLTHAMSNGCKNSSCWSSA